MENQNNDLELEKQKLELEKQKLELEKTKLQHQQQNTSSEYRLSKNDIARSLDSIKLFAILAMALIFLFIIPGLVCSIICFVKLITYKSENEKSNNGLRIAAAVLMWFTIFVGPILALVYVSQEKSNLNI